MTRGRKPKPDALKTAQDSDRTDLLAAMAANRANSDLRCSQLRNGNNS
jgi:hypothetical protein